MMIATIEKKFAAAILTLVFWLVSITIALHQVSASYQETFPIDSTCYLDAADAIRRGRFLDALSSYWSPGYPSAIAFVMLLTNPASAEFFSTLKIANLAIFLFALLVAQIFVNTVCRHYSTLMRGEEEHFQVIPELVLRVNCYVLFTWCFLAFGGLQNDTPDILFGWLIILATAMLLNGSQRVSRSVDNKNADGPVSAPSDSFARCALMGVVLACAFMTKAFGLILVPCFLFLMFWQPRSRRQLGGLAVSLTCFLAISLPCSVALKLTGRGTTFGTAFLLNYHWTIEQSDLPSIVFESATTPPPGRRYQALGRTAENSSPQRARSVPELHSDMMSIKNAFGPTMIKSPLDTGVLKHPPEKISELGNVYYFGNPIPGTCPLWFDVGYWQDGIKIGLAPLNSLSVFLVDWGYYFTYYLSFVMTSWALAAILSRSPCLTWRSVREAGVLWLLPITAMLFYSLDVNVVNEHPTTQRYFSAFVFLLSCGFLLSMRVPRSKLSSFVIASITVINFIFCALWFTRTMSAFADDYKQNLHRSSRIAKVLNEAGLKLGSETALVAPNQSSLDPTWARMAGVRITAEILDPVSFWAADEQARRAVLAALQKRGIQAIINDAHNKTLVTPPPGMGAPLPDNARAFENIRKTWTSWQEVPGTDFYFCPLR